MRSMTSRRTRAGTALAAILRDGGHSASQTRVNALTAASVASTVFALRAPSLELASMLTHVTELGSMPLALASAGHIVRAPSPAGLPIFLPARSLMLLMPLLLSQ